jgi:hypothetical protein
MKLRPASLSLCLLLAVAAPAMAQYIWIDAKGVKQLSDRAPPPDVPANRILKAPGKPMFNPNAPAPEAEETADTSEPKAKAAPTLAERNADFAKRQKQAAEAAKKTADDNARKASDAANCAAARSNQQALDQGLRMTTYNQAGEQVYMDDAQRANASRRNQEVLSNCK